jgi:DNA mismatch repair protein MutS2
LKSFSIIHGYGDGILSTGIHKHLGQNGLVESYRFALPDDGGQGKTYVVLK